MLTACSQAILSNDYINSCGKTWTARTCGSHARRHISEERSREKLREHRSQPIVKEYEEFHLLLKRLARRRYSTMAAFPIPPEEENTRGVKLPLSTSCTRSSYLASYARRFSPSCLRKSHIIILTAELNQNRDIAIQPKAIACYKIRIAT